MTEEIIIDGVNVAGCKYYTPTCVSTHLWGALTKSNKCEDNPNCYYKQLKRLEQENKELKIYIESNKQQVEEAEMLVMDNDRLQQEVENLKDTIYYDIEKYRIALEEIREIVKVDCKGCTAECDCDDDWTRYMIKNKINEVLGDEV